MQYMITTEAKVLTRCCLPSAMWIKKGFIIQFSKYDEKKSYTVIHLLLLSRNRFSMKALGFPPRLDFCFLTVRE